MQFHFIARLLVAVAVFFVAFGGDVGRPILHSAYAIPPELQYEGFGAATRGGEGQPVYRVTNLKDSGPGSLRDALARGNRMIVFAVQGEIALRSEIRVKGAFITIDGFTAMSPGITIKNYGLYFLTAHDVIVRGLRIRNAKKDGIWITDGAYNIVIDHVSISGSGDGNIDITRVGTRDITISWCILAEPAGEQKNMLLAFRSSRITLHHNLFTASSQRNPQQTYDDEYGTKAPDTTLDMRNNLIWNWGKNYGTRVRYGAKANVVGNYYAANGGDRNDALVICKKGGPTSSACDGGVPESFAQVYTQGNYSADKVNLNSRGTEAKAFPAPALSLSDAQSAACDVFAEAGVRPLDNTDTHYLSRIVLSCP
ncbi:MAG: polysaccharide lyase family 1 protein [Candidatus Binatia bacterium]